MPKPVHDMVNKMLEDPKFYPEKSKKQQEAIAWATAWSQYKRRKKKKKSSEEYSAVRKAELIQLNGEIEILEKHGFAKQAEILDEKFQRLAQSSSDVLTVEPADGGFQIVLNGEMPYRRMDTQSPVVFDSMKQAQIYAQKLANTEDFIYQP
jgi:hypothetical protein